MKLLRGATRQLARSIGDIKKGGYTQIVDSGQILICDPCYLERFFDSKEEFLKFYKKICAIEGEIKNEHGIVDMLKIQCDDGEYNIKVSEV